MSPARDIAALAAAAGHPSRLLTGGCTMGSISMAAYTVDAQCPTANGDDRPAAALPATLPPEDTNL